MMPAKTLERLGRRRRSGRRRMCCGVDREIRRAASALYGLEKCVCTRREREQLHGDVPVTQFGRMCERLGIEIIAASSPQAKGRVERNHGTHQDRLVKKMRRKKIQTHEQANEYLQQDYLPEHNGGSGGRQRRWRTITDERRARESCGKCSDWRASGSSGTTGWCATTTGCFKCRRRVGSTPRRKGKVTVCEWEDGRLQIRYRGRAVSWEEIPGPVPAEAVRTSGGQGPETKAAHAQSGSPSAAGISQDAPVEQARAGAADP